jgi:hypothetical protein
MPQVGFEPAILVFEQAKTVHALDRAATVIGQVFIRRWEIQTHLGLFFYSVAYTLCDVSWVLSWIDFTRLHGVVTQKATM